MYINGFQHRHQNVGLIKAIFTQMGEYLGSPSLVSCIRQTACAISWWDSREDLFQRLALSVTFTAVCCSGVVYMGGCVYAVGGFNGSLRVRTVDCYDPTTDRWTSVSSMQDRRSTLGAAVLNGLLYAVGGFDGSTGTPPPFLFSFLKRWNSSSCFQTMFCF